MCWVCLAASALVVWIKFQYVVAGETGDTPLVFTGSPPVNQHSCAVIQLPKGCPSQVCQKLGLCLLAL